MLTWCINTLITQNKSKYNIPDTVSVCVAWINCFMYSVRPNLSTTLTDRTECLHILTDCSQLSKTYYNVLFGSSTRDRRVDAYIGGRSENNIKCIVHDDLGQKNRRTRYNYSFSAMSLAYTSDFLSFIVVPFNLLLAMHPYNKMKPIQNVIQN